MLLAFPLALMVKQPAERQPGLTGRRAGLAGLAENLKDRRVVALLFVMLLLYSGYTPVFFFLEGYAQRIDIANPGLFFTLSTVSEIGVRLLGGTLFDRVSKVCLAAVSLVLISLGYLALAHLSGPVMFYGLGIFLGLGWGVVMPVLNALMFDISPAHLKGLNTNLGVQMFQGGFFAGPFIGGLALAHGNYRFLYYLCAGLTFCAIALMPFLSGRTGRLADSGGNNYVRG
ncbi:MAG: Major Facilitator Superfamily protein [Firmicutes bacterium ADurb.Bin456]|nr:MAG: Major Facilitator Superfamily protein [Firmicutes bacterium ADurb.Bin456]